MDTYSVDYGEFRISITPLSDHGKFRVYLARFAAGSYTRPGYGRDEADAITDLLRANRPQAETRPLDLA
jgi:hypothetical protein